jgi:hypothetical protein
MMHLSIARQTMPGAAVVAATVVVINTYSTQFVFCYHFS